MTDFVVKEQAVKQVLLRGSKIYRLNNIDEQLLDQDSEFPIGSVTKLFTALLVLILEGRKLLNIDDTVDVYVDSTEYDDFSQITIRQVLNHEAGLKRMPKEYVQLKYKSATQVFNKYTDEKYITLPIGVKNYSNWGYILLGKIIETITGSTYRALYRQYITDPLGMKHTKVGEGKVDLYFQDKPLCAKLINEKYFASSAGGLYSTVADLYKFASGFWNLLGREGAERFRSLTFCKENLSRLAIDYTGHIPGGYCQYEAKYDPRTLEFQSLRLSMYTNYDG